MLNMMKIRDAHHKQAHDNIGKAQCKQKRNYHLKHDTHRVCNVVHSHVIKLSINQKLIDCFEFYSPSRTFQWILWFIYEMLKMIIEWEGSLKTGG